jgi:hypothetical protein
MVLYGVFHREDPYGRNRAGCRVRTQNTLLVLELQRLREQTSILQKQLEEALLKITEQERPDSTTDGLLEKVVQGLVALGIPGLVLLVAVATSGFAGAAALTTALATLGGPLGMVGGIGVLMLLVLASRALARYGFPRVSRPVVKGLLAAGHSPQGIRDQIRRYPQWIISGELKRRVESVLGENEVVGSVCGGSTPQVP